MKYKACVCTLVLEMVTALALSLPGRATAADTIPVPAPATKCASSPEFTEQSVILVLDRTTKQSPGDNSGWKQAVHAIFENPSIGGSVRLMEVRDSDVTFSMSPALCVRTLSAAPPVRPTVESSGARVLAKKVSNWLGVDARQPSPNQVEDDAAIGAARRRLEQRAALQKRLEEVIDGDRPTYPSAIVVPLFKVLQTECMGRKICRLYIFSDLLDLKIRRHLKVGTEKAAASAQRAYQENVQIYHPQLQATQLHIVSWGIGRDDADAQKPLTQEEMLSLTSFWSTLFEQVCAMSGKGSSVTLTALFPSSEHAGCR